MEELQSTEALDREILEDARRKAQRILKSAEDSAAASISTWGRKTQDALEEMRNRYTGRIERERREIMARLPLDKRRSQLEKVETLLQSALDGYLSELSEEKQLSLLAGELQKRSGALDTLGGEVLFQGISPEKLRQLLDTVFPPPGDRTPRNWVIRKADSPHAFAFPSTFPSIVIDTQTVRITASVEGAARNFLRDQRAELTAALLGEAYA